MNKENLLTELKIWKSVCSSRKFCSDVNKPNDCEYINICNKTYMESPDGWEVDKIDKR